MGLRTAAVGLLLALAAWQAGAAGWIHAKAWLAEDLIEDAWRRSGDGAVVRPWPWADTWPVARLMVPRLGVERIVLAGLHGEALAFGPGLAELPGDGGVQRVIAGHRDTHLAFAADLAEGDTLLLEDAAGSVRYTVVSAVVADSREQRLAPPLAGRLILVTCWPFDAPVPGGPMRWVVTAVPAAAAGAQPLSRQTPKLSQTANATQTR